MASSLFLTTATTPTSLSFTSSSIFISSHQFNTHKFNFPILPLTTTSLSVSCKASPIPVLNFSGEKVGESLLDLRSAPPSTARAVVHRAVVTDLQNKRRGTASTLTRGEVRGGGRKPFPQKKTGRARRGSNRTPLRPGGGVIFGPKPRDWSVKINRKEKRLAISTAMASLRSALPTTPRVSAAAAAARFQQTRQAHAISNPTLANIEKRWEAMPPQEQAELWMALRDRMSADWNELTLQEKKAAYWIAFGPHGPRAQPPPGEGTKIFMYVMLGVGASGVIFGALRYFARGDPPTMTKEYQEASNEYLKEQKVEPITGLSSENYIGPGMVQSKPEGK